MMNSVFNGQIIQKTPFQKVFISPCPDDSGTSIGAANYYYNHVLGQFFREEMTHNYFGPGYNNGEIKNELNKYKLNYRFVEKIEAFAAQKLSEGKIIGWFQGKMEFGQRALGNRSILADPRNPQMKDKVNASIKYREAFRPFAPAILQEDVEDYFELIGSREVRFMEKVYPIKGEKRGLIPAVVHVDGTGRLQTIEKELNPLFYNLIYEFKKITGIPVILNTSFNLNGEPIVCTPSDAIRTFHSCGLDILVLGNYVLEK
jgi:carbamoyltransferase